MRIGVVNDLPACAAVLGRVVVSTGLHRIAWHARDCAQAIEWAVADPPDAILMDLDLPDMSCVVATRQIMLRAACPIIITTSSVDDNLHLVFKAMGAGALDVATGPSVELELGILDASELLRKISLVGQFRTLGPAVQVARPRLGARELLVVGASSGGPQALVQLLNRFQPGPDQAVVVVQHVDAKFAPRLVEYLAADTQRQIVGAIDGSPIDAGNVYVAVEDRHLVINRQGSLCYVDEPINVNYRPSIDVFFNSVAANWHGTACGVLLTGMGRDGAQGLLRLRQQGRYTVAQDEGSCVVFGMPRAAKEIGAAVDILSPDKIGPAVTRWFDARLGGQRRVRRPG